MLILIVEMNWKCFVYVGLYWVIVIFFLGLVFVNCDCECLIVVGLEVIFFVMFKFGVGFFFVILIGFVIVI